MNWREHAACRGKDPAIWFPTRGDFELEERAREVCRGCPVRPECREYALDAGEPMGIWGGLSERQREKILGRRLQPRTQGVRELRHGTESCYSSGCKCRMCKDGHASYVRDQRARRTA
ncbi:MAG: WhiB family transcriptional regulator [Chloroflexi bacterium]|nr:WhiB family transcriptional regulator [Chloroflexota bacterium]